MLGGRARKLILLLVLGGAALGVAVGVRFLGSGPKEFIPLSRPYVGGWPGEQSLDSQSSDWPVPPSSSGQGMSGRAEGFLPEKEPRGYSSVEEAWADYRPRLAALKARYEGELNFLLARALADYQRCRGNRAALIALVPGYIREGISLEREADAAFASLMAELELDLRASGLPLDLVSDLRRQYREMKRERRKEIFDRGWQLIWSS